MIWFSYAARDKGKKARRGISPTPRFKRVSVSGNRSLLDLALIGILIALIAIAAWRFLRLARSPLALIRPILTFRSFLTWPQILPIVLRATHAGSFYRVILVLITHIPLLGSSRA
jgi:hypothetical protein